MSKKYTMIGMRNGNDIKVKHWDKAPSKKSVRSLRDRYDNEYGAYLAYKYFINGKEVPMTDFMVAITSEEN